jgi:hypothetical protein
MPRLWRSLSCLTGLPRDARPGTQGFIPLSFNASLNQSASWPGLPAATLPLANYPEGLPFRSDRSPGLRSSRSGSAVPRHRWPRATWCSCRPCYRRSDSPVGRQALCDPGKARHGFSGRRPQPGHLCVRQPERIALRHAHQLRRSDHAATTRILPDRLRHVIGPPRTFDRFGLRR